MGATNSWYPRNPNIDQNLQTDSGTNMVRGFPVLYQMTPTTMVGTKIATGDMSSGTSTISGTDITQVDVPRNLSVDSDDNADLGTDYPVVVSGADISGAVISESIDLNGTTVAYGTLAFGSITNVALPSGAGSGSVGDGTLFGIPDAVALLPTADLVFDGTRTSTPTMSVSSGTLSANTITPSAAPDGTKVMSIRYINFATGN